MSGIDEQFQLLAKQYTEETDAHVPKVGKVPGATSMFNPFNIFRYSKYGLNPNQYRANLHFDTGGSLNAADSAALAGVNIDPFDPNSGDLSARRDQDLASANVLNNFESFKDVRKTIENPTASNIIEWSRAESTPKARLAKGAAPYSVTDFLHCTYYGKVPNNRLVTLRRYPIPVEDNLAISAAKAPLVPLAQAVTWFGEDVGNPINNVINLSWGFNWRSIQSKVQDIQGNELTVEDLVSALPFEVDEKVIQVLKTQIFTSGKVDILKLTGFDVNANEYIKNAYGDGGPYWNRVLGPVNVIDRTNIRDRGYLNNSNDPVILKFKYSLRTYNGLNPKMLFLDLYTNFLSLTYNTAPFWGGGARYFQQTGVTIPALRMEQEILTGDMLGAVQTGVEELSQMASSRLNELINLAQLGTKYIDDKGNVTDEDALTELINPDLKRIDQAALAQQRGDVLNPLERALAPRLGRLLRKPLLYRSILDGRAVGEWHITVGNPMNPIAMIGNLCLDEVKVSFSDILGIDDFPTEVEFTVRLRHGRPRAKQDLESIFNLGNGAMSFNPLPPPSSAGDSYGENTTARLNAAFDGTNLDPEATRETGIMDELVDVGDNIPENMNQLNRNQSKVNSDMSINNAPILTEEQIAARIERIDNLAKAYSSRVTALYGEGFGNSPILKDYFTDIKTAD